MYVDVCESIKGLYNSSPRSMASPRPFALLNQPCPPSITYYYNHAYLPPARRSSRPAQRWRCGDGTRGCRTAVPACAGMHGCLLKKGVCEREGGWMHGWLLKGARACVCECCENTRGDGDRRWSEARRDGQAHMGRKRTQARKKRWAVHHMPFPPAE